MMCGRVGLGQYSELVLKHKLKAADVLGPGEDFAKTLGMTNRFHIKRRPPSPLVRARAQAIVLPVCFSGLQ